MKDKKYNLVCYLYGQEGVFATFDTEKEAEEEWGFQTDSCDSSMWKIEVKDENNK